MLNRSAEALRHLEPQIPRASSPSATDGSE